jgi:hypothetical protein
VPLRFSHSLSATVQYGPRRESCCLCSRFPANQLKKESPWIDCKVVDSGALLQRRCSDLVCPMEPVKSLKNLQATVNPAFLPPHPVCFSRRLAPSKKVCCGEPSTAVCRLHRRSSNNRSHSPHCGGQAAESPQPVRRGRRRKPCIRFSPYSSHDSVWWA